LRIQPDATDSRELGFDRQGNPCDGLSPNSPPDKSLILQFGEIGRFGLLLAVVLLSTAFAQELPAPVKQPSLDNLTLWEEEYAYAASNPAARVTAFLKIADNKLLAARRLQKSNPDASLIESLKGYYTALEGANLAVSWGRDLGEDMQRQNSAITKLVRRHAGILERLGTSAKPQERQALLEMRDFLLTQRTLSEDVGKGSRLLNVSTANRGQAPPE
jgi:hypothetical protein